MFSWSRIINLDGILIIRVKIKLSVVGKLSLVERLHGARIILALGSSHLSDRMITCKLKAKNISHSDDPGTRIIPPPHVNGAL